MVSLDLKDAYLQVPMHPESHKFLRFVAGGKVSQFKVLCFGLSTAPQVFTRVMAPVSAFLHRTGIRLRRYLDDWLIQASSWEQVLLALETVLQPCKLLGIVVNWEKSRLIPTRRMVYLGVLLDSISFRVSPALKRVEKLLSIGDVFLSSVKQPVSSWLELLGVLSSMIQLIPGGTITDEITPVYSPEVMGSGKSDGAGVMESRDSCRSRVVVRSRSFGFGNRSRTGVPSARLVVGRGLGGTSGRRSSFRPVGSGGVGILHKRQGASGYRESSSLLRFSDKGLVHGGLCGQLDSHCSSLKLRGNQISSPKCYSSAHLEVVRDFAGLVDSTIYHGPSQCASGLIVLSQSGARVRMDAQDRGIPRAPEEVASVNLSFRHISKSPMFTIFFTVPRSELVGHGCSSPELGWVAGVCLSTLVSDSGSPQEAPIVLWGPTDHCSSLLASKAVVS